MTRWTCPAPDCSKDWDSCQRVVSHLHATSCKTILSDPVAIAPFLAAASRWLCLPCSKTWHSRTPVCRDCGLAAPSPSVALPLPDIAPPPVPSPRLPSLSTVLCTGVPTFVYMPKSTRSEVATAWVVVAQAVAGASASMDDLTRFLAFPKAISSDVPASASRGGISAPAIIRERIRRWTAGDVFDVFEEAACRATQRVPNGTSFSADKTRIRRTCGLARQGAFRKAAQALSSAPQAPSGPATVAGLLLPCLGPSLTDQFFHRQRSFQHQRSNPHCLVSSAGPPRGLLASAILIWPTCSMRLRPRLRPWHLMPLRTL
jgi:hypothetical protein